MILADKLNKLRMNAGLSQEQLAEKMKVSRQSISKWESGASIPSMDKVVELSNIYGISTDYLLKDEMEELPGEIIPDFGDETEAIREVALEDARDFLSRIKDIRKKIALGVLLCILSPAPMMLFFGLSETPQKVISEEVALALGMTFLLPIVAIAVVLFITSSIKTKKYEFLETEGFRLAYGVKGILEKEEEEYLPVYYKNIAIGVVLCIIAALPVVSLSILIKDDAQDYFMMYAVAFVLFVVSIGVFLIVRVSILKSSYDKLLQKEDYTKKKKEASKKLQLFSSVYWTGMTAIYLAISFITFRWDMTWIIWPVAGVAFVAIYAILESVVSKKES